MKEEYLKKRIDRDQPPENGFLWNNPAIGKVSLEELQESTAISTKQIGYCRA